MAETCTLEPLALRTAVMFLLVPTTALPKSSADGLTANWPGARAVPDKAMFKLGLEAFEVSRRFPVASPAAEGVNATLKVKFSPGVNTRGKFSPDTLKPEPVTVA